MNKNAKRRILTALIWSEMHPDHEQVQTLADGVRDLMLENARLEKQLAGESDEGKRDAIFPARVPRDRGN